MFLTAENGPTGDYDNDDETGQTRPKSPRDCESRGPRHSSTCLSQGPYHGSPQFAQVICP